MSSGRAGTPQVTDWPRNPYFGTPWDAPEVDGARQAPTPVGQLCAWCTVPVADGDQGFLIGCARLDENRRPYGSIEPWHRECRLRSTAGSPAHLDGECSCHTGRPDARPQTPQGKRAEALEVWDRIQRGQIGRPRTA